MIPIRYNVRSLAVRKATTAATAFGVALVVFVLGSALMLSAGVKKTLAASGKDDVAIVLRKGSQGELGSTIEDATISTVLAQPGVKQDGGKALGSAETVVVLALEKVGVKGLTNVQVRGVTEDSLKLRPTLTIVRGRPARPGSDEVIIGERIAGRFKGVDLDQSFDLKKNRPVKVVGIFTDHGSSYESEVWADRDTLRAAFGREGSVSSVRVRLESASKLEGFQTAVEQDKRLGLSVTRETKYYEDQSEGLAIFISVMGSLIAIFFSVGAMIGAMITMYAAVANRQREIGTLRALGFSRSSILLSFLMESSLLAIIGGIIGTAASMCMGFVSFSMINFASWSELVFTFDPTPKILVVALVFSVGMGLIGGFFPALRASRVSPIAAMRG
jgi:putative ABC transport system permease protein